MKLPLYRLRSRSHSSPKLEIVSHISCTLAVRNFSPVPSESQQPTANRCRSPVSTENFDFSKAQRQVKRIAMKLRASIETIICRTRMIVSVFASWPLPHDTKPSDVRRRNIWWWFIMIHIALESTAELYHMYLNLDDPYLIIRVTAEAAAVISALLKMVICRLEEPRLQGLLAELYEFLKYATTEEMELIQFYMDKSSSTHLLSFICTIIGLSICIIGPAIFPNPLPGSTAYPFSIEPFWIWAILYVSHIFITVNVCAMIVLDFMYSILLWFTVARFEMMCLEFQRASNADDVKCCIRKHQELIDYADRLCATTRPMALHILSLTILGITTGGFTLIGIGERGNLSWWDLVEHVLYNLAAGIQLFIFTWPADYLMEMSVKIRDSAYSSAWFGEPEMCKNILYVAHRSQIPMVIKINGFLPALSLELFGNAVSTTFTYLAMLRAMTAE